LLKPLIMITKRLLARIGLPALLLLLTHTVFAQKVITGKVTDGRDNSPIVGASIQPKDGKTGTSSGPDGSFQLTVDNDVTRLVISYVGFGTQEVDIAGKTSVDVALTASGGGNLNEVVVVGYGTARKKDLTGSVVSVKAKDFNQGIQVSADQLIQGKVAGVQILNNSGQPGGAVSVRIRGNSSIRTGNQPLYVVDGVQLDGRTSRPGVDARGLGQTPDANPLNFINPADIASIDVLKDASATAIYGSRGANGVIIITTKRGQTGAPKLDFQAAAGFSNVLKKLEVLDANQYRDALKKYNVTGADWGGNVDAFDAITRTGFFQNYNIGISAGTDNARFRGSFGYFDQDGTIAKSGLKRYSANLNGSFRFLESKRLGLDFNIITAQTVEQIAPVTTTAGFEGSLIGQALQWNPTRPLRNPDGSLNLKGADFPATNYNPLAMSEAYDDEAKTTSVLASITPSFKFTDELEYKMILSLNYSSGVRRVQTASYMTIPGIEGLGWAQYGNGELLTRQVTHTLNYAKQITKNVYLNATAGYEYVKFDNKGLGLFSQNFTSNSIPYTNYFQGSNATGREIFSFADPSSELQSYFARLNFNFKEKYLLTATFRADGSSKFGENNKYGYFPSLGAAWNISNEDFMKDAKFFNMLKFRIGWGVTGNQEFPAGSAQEQYAYVGPNAIRLVNVANPDLKWENTSTTNVGIDFSVANNRITGTFEYFNKRTKDLLFNFDAIPPAPASKYWINLDGEVVNSGVDLTVFGLLVNQKDFQVEIGANASFVKNELNGYEGPAVLTGAISGQGLTGATAQRLENGEPLNSFYIGKFLGFDKDGKALYDGDPNLNRFYVGDPNPKTLLGFSLTVNYKKLTFTSNLNGAFGHHIYNNTTQATLAIGNIKNNRNIAVSVYNPTAMEDAANAQPVSTRYLEKGDYLKLANATLSYNLGKIGNFIRGSYIYVTGQNLFVITKYTGFDPEVNTPKPVDNVPSFGIEYTPYPSARSFTFGFNISL